MSLAVVVYIAEEKQQLGPEDQAKPEQENGEES